MHATRALEGRPVREGRSPRSRGRRVFFFQAEDGIRDYKVTGVQTCALPIFKRVLETGRADLKKLAEGMAPTRGLELVSQATDLVDGIIEKLAVHALEALEKRDRKSVV